MAGSGRRCASGWVFLKSVDWALWANLVFFVGAVMWVVSPALCLSPPDPDDYEPCGVVAFAAAAAFLVDSLIYFVHWRQLYHAATSRTQRILQGIDWFLLGNCFFIVGVVLDFLYEAEFLDNVEKKNIASMVGSACWVIYAGCEILRCLLDMSNRAKLRAAIRASLIPTSTPQSRGYSAEVVKVVFAWDLLGAFAFLIAQTFYVIAAGVCWYEYTDQCIMLELGGASLYVVNSIMTFIEMIQVRRLKRSGLYYITEAEEDDIKDMFEGEKVRLLK